MSPQEFVASILGARVSGFPEHVAGILAGMKSEIGYEERGGRLIVDVAGADHAPGIGDVIGRTPWIGARWWFDRPDPSLDAQRARAAVDKAIAGERLGARQQRFIDYAIAEATQRL